MTDSIPPPGSPDALAGGCNCPPQETPSGTRYYRSLSCPVHSAPPPARDVPVQGEGFDRLERLHMEARGITTVLLEDEDSDESLANWEWGADDDPDIEIGGIREETIAALCALGARTVMHEIDEKADAENPFLLDGRDLTISLFGDMHLVINLAEALRAGVEATWGDSEEDTRAFIAMLRAIADETEAALDLDLISAAATPEA